MFRVHWKRMCILLLFGWNVLYISVKYILYKVSFKADCSLLIFCLDDLSIDVSRVLKSPTLIALFSF